MTVSESCFVEYCQRLGYEIHEIPRQPNVRKTADFRVKAGQVEIVVEIKELTSGDQQHRYGAGGDDRMKSPGDFAWRAREHLREAASQLRPYRSEKRPMVVILFDNIPPSGSSSSGLHHALDPEAIAAAMWGAPKGGEPGLLGPAERRYVSAVSVLHGRPNLHLCTYYNPYAAVPLPPELFSGPSDQRLGKVDGTPSSWRLLPL